MAQNQILTGRSRPAPHPSEMILDPGPRPVVSPNTAQAFGAIRADERAFVGADLGRAQMGQAVQGIGNQMSQLVLKQMEAVNIRKENEAQNTMARADGEIAAKLAAEPDEMKWEGIAAKHIQTVRDSISKTPMSPVVKEAVESDLSRWEAHRVSGTQTASAERSFQRAGGAIEDKLTLAETRQDKSSHEETLRGAVQRGYYTEQGAELRRVKFNETGKRLQLAAKADRFNAVQNLAIARTRNEGAEGVLSDLEQGKIGRDLTPFDQERVRGMVDEVERDRSAAVMDDVITGIQEGKINNEAAVKAQAGPFFGPKLIQQALGMVKQRSTLQQKQDIEANGVKNAVALRLDIQDYDSSKDKSREQYFELRQRIAATVPEDYASELEADLKTRYGVLPPEVKVRPELQKNVSELISAYYDPQYGAIVWKQEIDDLERGKYTRVDRELQDKAINAETNVRKQMDDWFRANPDKVGDFKAAREQLEIVLPGGTRAKVLEGIKKAAALKSAGAQGEAGPEGADFMDFVKPPSGTRVTSYAYDNDETPDSNSAAGIGAFVPASEAAKIKRGEDSPYRLQEGDFAVSPDVERSLKASGIRPKDTVEIQFADGSTQTGRWMDRTSQDLKGRWDFYQGGKGSKHKKEGGKVTGFRRPD